MQLSSTLFIDFKGGVSFNPHLNYFMFHPINDKILLVFRIDCITLTVNLYQENVVLILS